MSVFRYYLRNLPPAFWFLSVFHAGVAMQRGLRGEWWLLAWTLSSSWWMTLFFMALVVVGDQDEFIEGRAR